MNIKDLEYFVALSDAGSFRKAATHCHTSQPTISNCITRMEKELGTLLFNRTTRSLALTHEGAEILVCAQAILTNINLIRDIASSNGEKNEAINLGLTTSIAHYFYAKVVDAITGLIIQTVNVHEIKKEHLKVNLNSGVNNCMLIACDDSFNDYEKHLVAKFPYVLAVSAENPLSEKDEIDPSDIKDSNILSIQEEHSLDTSHKRIISRSQLNIGKKLIFYNMEVLKVAIKQKKGIALLPEYVVKKEEGITYIPLTNNEITRNIYLIHKKSNIYCETYDLLAHNIGYAILSKHTI